MHYPAFSLAPSVLAVLAASAILFAAVQAFPGLWLDVAALLEGRRARVLEVAQQGVASPEHAEFVRRCAAHPQQS